MKFCEDHWSKMRSAVEARGMSDLVAKSGEVAVLQLKEELAKGEQTVASFDPLMSMHWAIAGNAMDILGQLSLNLMIDGFEYECPICYLNSFRTEDGRCGCDDPNCTARKPGSIQDFKWMIERSADDALIEARRLGLIS